MNRAPGELERVIMDVLWAHPEPMTARAVSRALADHGLAYTTIKTVLDRLHRKRLVSRARDGDRAWRYRAARGRDQHVAELMLQALDQTADRDGALMRFAEAVDDTDARVLRRALDRDPATPRASREEDRT